MGKGCVCLYLHKVQYPWWHRGEETCWLLGWSRIWFFVREAFTTKIGSILAWDNSVMVSSKSQITEASVLISFISSVKSD